MTDIATNHLLYNGENLYYQRLSLGGTGIEGFYDSEKFKAEFSGEERPEDVVRQSYADLCFDLDYFFGHPGVAKLDAALAEKGLDQALTDLGEEGEELKEGLLSASLADYTAALFKLFTIYLSDGHTVYTGSAELSMAMEARKDPSFLGINFELALDMLRSPVMMKQSAHLLIPSRARISSFPWPVRACGETTRTANTKTRRLFVSTASCRMRPAGISSTRAKQRCPMTASASSSKG